MPRPLRRSGWHRTGLLLGAALGLAVGIGLEWYFTWGPGARIETRGLAHGLWLLLLGFPTTLLVPVVLSPFASPPAGLVRLLLALAVTLSWGLLGAGLGAGLGAAAGVVRARLGARVAGEG